VAFARDAVSQRRRCNRSRLGCRRNTWRTASICRTGNTHLACKLNIEMVRTTRSRKTQSPPSHLSILRPGGKSGTIINCPNASCASDAYEHCRSQADHGDYGTCSAPSAPPPDVQMREMRSCLHRRKRSSSAHSNLQRHRHRPRRRNSSQLTANRYSMFWFRFQNGRDPQQVQMFSLPE